jgi:cellulose biosynthesis protein BcsQ
MTTNPYFCPTDRALAIQCEKLQKTIDFLLDHVSDDNSDQINEKLMNKALVSSNNLKNLYLLLESNTKDKDYVQQHKKKFIEVIMPMLKKHFDIIIVDTSGFISSEITKYMLRSADLVLNFLTQDSVALDEYGRFRFELEAMVKKTMNILNAVREMQPDIKAIRNDYVSDLYLVHDDVNFASACNTGNLLEYMSKENSPVARDIKLIMGNILEVLELPVSATTGGTEQRKERRGFRLWRS